MQVEASAILNLPGTSGFDVEEVAEANGSGPICRAFIRSFNLCAN
jgi:hypothetical protein